MLYPDRGSEWIDEDVPTDTYPMARPNLAAEASANRFSAAGGTGVVLRFGWFYGPGATHSEQFLALARRHICVQMGRPDTYVSSIHVADGGAAVAAALHAPAATFNVVDDEPLTKRSYADAAPGRPLDITHPLVARQQCSLQTCDRMGAALRQRPRRLDRHRDSTRPALAPGLAFRRSDSGRRARPPSSGALRVWSRRADRDRRSP
jgi:nucleoside-diphosphate-sugar epimerase